MMVLDLIVGSIVGVTPQKSLYVVAVDPSKLDHVFALFLEIVSAEHMLRKLWPLVQSRNKFLALSGHPRGSIAPSS